MTDTTHTSPPEAKSTATLLSEAMSHVNGLLRGEIDLVRAELNENLRKAGVAVGMIVAAAIIVLTALNTLTAAMVAGLARLLAGGGEDAAAVAGMTGWAALIVGVIYAVIALILLRKGVGDLKATSLAPSRTARNVQKDAYAVKEGLNG